MRKSFLAMARYDRYVDILVCTTGARTLPTLLKWVSRVESLSLRAPQQLFSYGGIVFIGNKSLPFSVRVTPSFLIVEQHPILSSSRVDFSSVGEVFTVERKPKYIKHNPSSVEVGLSVKRESSAQTFNAVGLSDALDSSIPRKHPPQGYQLWFHQLCNAIAETIWNEHRLSRDRVYIFDFVRAFPPTDRYFSSGNDRYAMKTVPVSVSDIFN